MTKIKLCGLSREEDIKSANELLPDYIGFVFAKKSKRYVEPEKAYELKQMLDSKIKAVGVFVNEDINVVASLLDNGTIDIAQLHGSEDEEYIKALRVLSDKPLIKAFMINDKNDITTAEKSTADFILLDSKVAGSGTTFDWSMLECIARPYFLAGGLDTENVADAVKSIRPFAVDVSSGIETDGIKDKNKMTVFINRVRKENKDD